MQHAAAMKLRKAWGEDPCDHPNLEKEYYLGSDTMDYVCTTCGKEFTNQEKENRNDKKSNSK